MPAGLAPWGAEPYGAVPLAQQQNARPAWLRALLDDPLRRICLMVEIDAWDWRSEATETLRYANSKAFNPDGSDMEARVAGEVSVARRIADGPGGLYGGRIETTFSEIGLANGDGALDGLFRTHTFDGRPIRLHLAAVAKDAHGREVPPAYADFTLVARTIMGQPLREDGLFRLTLDDLGQRLRGPLHLATFGGGGGASGSAEIRGLSHAYAAGSVPNAPLQVLDSETFTHHACLGPIQAILAVRESGVDVPVSGIYPSYADLPANGAIAAGTCVVSVAGDQAVVRFAEERTGTLTCDLLGDNTEVTLPDGTVLAGFGVTLGAVVRRLLIRLGGLTGAELDEGSFALFDAAHPAHAVGWYVPVGSGGTTLDDLLADMAFGAGAVVGPDRLGRYGLRRLEAPLSQTAWEIGSGEAARLETEALPYGAALWSFEVGYLRVWRVQGAAELAAGASNAARRLHGQEWRMVTHQDAAVRTRHATASRAPFVASPFLSDTPAAGVRDHLIHLYQPGRERFVFEAATVPFLLDVLTVIGLRDERHGLADGLAVLVDSVRDVITAEGRVYTEVRAFGGPAGIPPEAIVVAIGVDDAGGALADHEDALVAAA